MKKVILFAMVASLLVFAGCEKEKDDPVVPIDPDVTDTIDNPGVSDTIDIPDIPDTPPSGDGLFSVSAGHQVRFAPGNLVYNGGYSFAAHQYDYGGYFGWGTGSNPTNISGAYVDYPTFDDWGNHIAGGWRTLTQDEWQYVIWDRTDAAAKRGAATVCGVYGMVLLPDNFSGGTFTAGFDYEDFDYYEGWSRNVYDASSWSDMEAAGAVFLPATGSCFGIDYGMEMDGVGTEGYYWSSTPDFVDDADAYAMRFDEGHVHNAASATSRSIGHSVRLVQEYHGN